MPRLNKVASKIRRFFKMQNIRARVSIDKEMCDEEIIAILFDGGEEFYLFDNNGKYSLERADYIPPTYFSPPETDFVSMVENGSLSSCMMEILGYFSDLLVEDFFNNDEEEEEKDYRKLVERLMIMPNLATWKR